MGFTGYTGPTGQTGFTGVTGAKAAIVEIDGEYRALYCVEAPEVRFEDLLEVEAAGGEESCQVDPTFLKACEPETVVVLSVMSEAFLPLGADVDGGTVVFSRGLRPGEKVRVKLSGVRLGFCGVRMDVRTREEAEANAKRWSV